MAVPDSSNQLQAVRAECESLREEVRQLKDLLARHNLTLPASEPETQSLAPEKAPGIFQPDPTVIATVVPPIGGPAKVKLFRSIFRGREDVYAERWTSRDGTKSGYQPASQRDWDAWHRAKPEDQKRVDKETRKLLPLTDHAITQHLSGDRTLGVFPLLTDESCWFLAADFDKKTWREDALAFVATCQKSGVATYLERSRSGKGGHVWIFFERAVPAVLARKLGCAMLTQTMERRHQLGLDSYDRFFQSRHHAQRRIRQSDRAAPAMGAAKSEEQRLC